MYITYTEGKIEFRSHQYSIEVHRETYSEKSEGKTQCMSIFQSLYGSQSLITGNTAPIPL
jgi:hypothetical protein